MKLLRWFAVSLMLFSVFGTGIAYAEDGFLSWLLSVERKNEVAPVKNEVYEEECGSCHYPYQPGLLPSGSWQKLLAADALEDHFGDNAELDNDLRTELLSFLEQNAADKSYFKRSRKIFSSLKGETPLRITEVPYIRYKHEELTDDMVKNNPKVKSLSFCNACHREIKYGRFDDDTVDIPGYGNWTW